MKKYQIIYADPPWEQKMAGKYRTRHKRIRDLPYPTMTVKEICNLPIGKLASETCHLWLWTTNQSLPYGFEVIKAWGFKYLSPITWVKPSGCGNYFVSVTQTLLFGYKEKCIFPMARYKPTVLYTGLPKKHSQKPEEFYKLIESISPEPRLELFARPVSPLFPKRNGWDVWGNEIKSDIDLKI